MCVPEDPTQPPFRRTVIRLPELGMVLTRFDDNGRTVNMLVRVRPGWEALAHYLRTGRSRKDIQ